MHNYEITVIPLTETAKASGSKPLVAKIDAYVLCTITKKEDGNFMTIADMQGPLFAWEAFAELVRYLMEEFPEQTTEALEIARERARKWGQR